uniref:TPR_REGION domain-containing protein n=1 Tax=Panagrellus redivivus TaxID=6233 RepID=A0A7E4V2X0_PANRE
MDAAQEPNLVTDQTLTTVIDRALVTGNYKSALFWAGKRLALFESQDYDEANPGTSPLELARYLKVLTAASEWQSVITMITKSNLQTRHIVFAYYYANALFNVGKHEDIAALPLGPLVELEGHPFPTADYPVVDFSNVRPIDEEMGTQLESMAQREDITSRMLFLLARTYDVLQNRPFAKTCAEASIRANPFAVETIEFVLEKHLLKPSQIRQIFENVVFPAEDAPLKDVIRLLLDRYDLYPETYSDPALADIDRILTSDPSILHARAAYFHANGYFEKAFEVTSKIVETYGVAHKCLKLHLACCVELRKTTAIYEIAHTLTTTALDDCRTFYAVGCYYFAARQYGQAKEFFNRCVTSYPHDGYAWIAYGHALAMSHDHDQAMNCYMRATRYLENYIEPTLYMGIQYVHSNSLTQADHAFASIQNPADKNPFVCHERATVLIMHRDFMQAYREYYDALEIITRTRDQGLSFLDLIEQDFDSYWSPLIFNMGFVLFCAKKFCKAIMCFKRVLVLGFEVNMTNAHIGYCYLASGRPSQGIDALRKALAKEPNMIMAKKAYDRATYINSQMPTDLPGFTDAQFEELLASIPPYEPRAIDTRPNVAPHLLPETARQTCLNNAEECYVRHRSGTAVADTTPAAVAATNADAIYQSAEASGSSGETQGGESSHTQETLLEPEVEGEAPAAAEPVEQAAVEEEEPEAEEGPMTSAEAAAANAAAAAAASGIDPANLPPPPTVSPIPGSSTDRPTPRRTRAATPHTNVTPRLVPQPDSAESHRTGPGSPGHPLTGILNVPTDRHTPMMDIEDPHTLMSSWLIDDLYYDTVRVADEVMADLRPEPNPRPIPPNALPSRTRPRRQPLPMRHVYPRREI